MNFFAHQAVAARTSDQPRFLLGAMLPDLASMIGTRILRVDDAELELGIAHHHQADAAFHGASIFSELCASAVHELCSHGVGRGTARAVGHVGVELLLDGFLSHDLAARDRYTRALTLFVQDDLGARLALRHDDDRARLALGLLRLRAAPIPEGYRDPEFVVERLEHILSRRPRLAMAERDRPHVLRWTQATHRDLAGRYPALLAEVESGLTPAT
jgi:hypothetical protein